jgi:hypothetical protein
VMLMMVPNLHRSFVAFLSIGKDGTGNLGGISCATATPVRSRIIATFSQLVGWAGTIWHGRARSVRLYRRAWH